jgi:hypothetical protein
MLAFVVAVSVTDPPASGSGELVASEMENLPTSFRAPLTGAAGNTAVVGWHPELAIAVTSPADEQQPECLRIRLFSLRGVKVSLRGGGMAFPLGA